MLLRSFLEKYPLASSQPFLVKRSKDAEPQALVDFNFAAPLGPTRNTGPVVAGQTATAVWLLDESSGNFVDEIGGVELTPASVGRESMIGLWSGADLISMSGARFGGGSIEAAAGDNAFFDQGAGDSFAVFQIFKSRDTAGNPANTLFGKQTSTATAGFVSLFSSATRIRSVVRDNAANQVTVDHNGDHNDGAWHFFAMVVNRTAQTLTCYSDVNTTPTSGSISAVGSLSIAAPFKVGRAANYNGAVFDCPYVALWEGAGAEALGQSDFEALFNHAVPPARLDNYVRASSMFPIVGDESGFGLRVQHFSTGQFASGYEARVRNGNKIGAIHAIAQTNIVTDSATAIAQGTATITGTYAEAPDGLTASTRVQTSTANAGARTSNAPGLTNLQQYVGSVFVRSTSGAGSQSLEFTCSVPGAGVTAFTATEEWQRVEVQFTGDGGIDNLIVRTPTATAVDFEVWGWQIETGTTATDLIPTSGGTASRVLTQFRFPASAQALTDGYYIAKGGESECRFVGDGIDFVSDGFGSNSGNRMYVGNTSARHYRDGTNANLSYTALPDGQDATTRFRWNSAAALPDNADGDNIDFLLDDAVQSGTLATWTPNAIEQIISLGQNYILTGNRTRRLFMTRFRVFDRARAVDELIAELDFTKTTKPDALDQYARASVAAPITGVGANGVEVTKFASGQYAYQYDAAWSHASKLAMLHEPAATNLVHNSESFSFIAGTGSNNAAVAPDGTTTAAQYTRTGGGGAARTASPNATVSSGATYTISAFVKEDPNNPGGTFRLNANGLAASYAAVPATWTRVTETFVAGGTTSEAEVQLGTNGDSILVWGFQIEAGSDATSYIPTSGGTASRVVTDSYVSGAYAKQFINHKQGEIEIDVLGPAQASTGLWRVKPQAGATDEKYALTGSVRIVDGLGAVYSTISSPGYLADTAHTCRLLWNSRAVLPGRTQRNLTIFGATTSLGNTGAFTTGDTECDLHVGQFQSGSLPYNGAIARLRVYTRAQAE